MFNGIVNNFDLQMIRDCREKLSSFCSEDEHNDEYEQEQYSYNTLNGIPTRIVWVTNYTNNEDFPIHVPADDPLIQLISNSSNTNEIESLLSNEKDDISLLNKIHSLDLSKLNLDDLLLLLYRLEQKTTQNSVTSSASTISSSSNSSSTGFINRTPISTLHSLSPTLSHAVHSSLSMLNEIPSYSHPINRRQSSFTLSNIADVPKQLTTTLAKPISSFHSQNSKHIHSPNDVVDKLLQSFHLRNNKNHQKLIQPKSTLNYTYQQSQQHKANLISNLLSSNSIQKSPYFLPSNNFYH